MRFSSTRRAIVLAATFAAATGGFAQETPKGATEATRAANAALLEQLPFSDTQAFEDAHRGFIAPPSTDVIARENGAPIWDPGKYAFIEEGAPAPDTVNPSLWRQSQLINIAGLYEVV